MGEDLRPSAEDSVIENEKTEGKEKTLEEQAAIYAEMFDEDKAKILERAQALQAEMQEDDKRVLTMLVYGREGTTPVSAWEMVKAENPTRRSYDLDLVKMKIKTQGETDKAFVAFARYAQEADEDSLGENARKAVDWEKTGEKYMTPKQRMLAGEMYRRATGKQLDTKNATMHPGSRSESGGVPYSGSGFDFGYGKVCLGRIFPENHDPSFGVRRVVSKEF